MVTPSGERFFAGIGIDLVRLEKGRRRLCRPCLDWSERRHHLAGALGAALAARCFELGWIERTKIDRAIAVTARGRACLAATFGVGAEELRV